MHFYVTYVFIYTAMRICALVCANMFRKDRKIVEEMRANLATN